LQVADRSFALNGAGDYRYGFNGKEKDQDGEWGSNTHYDYGFRIYNPAIGKFLSVDPLADEYPFYTPYQFAGNMPITSIDLDGLEPWKVTGENGEATTTYGSYANQGEAQAGSDANNKGQSMLTFNLSEDVVTASSQQTQKKIMYHSLFQNLKDKHHI